MVKNRSDNPVIKNPFVVGNQPNAREQFSDLQKKIADYVQKEAREKIASTYGFQPPSIKIFGPDAEQEKKSIQKKEKEFLDKYNISKTEHDLLVDLIFHGKLKMNYKALGHIFVIQDLDPETRRFVAEISQRPDNSNKVNALIKIKAISMSLLEIDGLPINKEFLEKYLWKMQFKIIDILYQMHLITEKYKMYLYEKLPNFSRTPTSRARYAICKDMQTTVNNPIFNKMSEEQIYWHYINTVKNQEIENDTVNSKLEYLTWFINPEMAKKVKEKQQVDFESNTNMIQKYAFMDGIINLMKKDLSTDVLNTTMTELMAKMSDPTAQSTQRDPWDEPEELKQIEETGAFVKKASQFKPKFPQTPDEGQVGMFGGNKDWHKEK